MQDTALHTQVERHFGYLLSEHGYRITESTNNRVRLESATVFVEVVYDSTRSFELGILIDRLGSRNPPYGIDEVLRLRGVPAAREFSLAHAGNGEDVAAWLIRFAGALRTFAGDFIAGDPRSFSDLEERRLREADSDATARELRTARSEAETAWRNKDFAGVVKAFKPLRTALSDSELGKLEYAEKKVQE